MGLFSRGKSQEIRQEIDEGVLLEYEGKRLTRIDYLGDGDFEMPVVGLPYHANGVLSVEEFLADDGPGMHQLTAQLVREPRNPYDRNAIRVDVLGDTVGYMPAEYAAVVAPRLDKAGKDLSVTCPVAVATDQEGSTRYMRLDIVYDAGTVAAREAQAQAFANAAAAARDAVDKGQCVDLWSTAAKPTGEVVGESAHVDAITRIVTTRSGRTDLPPEGLEVEAAAVLLPQPDGVFVIVDGEPVGVLVDYLRDSSRRVLTQLSGQGRVARVRARVWCRGGVGSVQVDVPMDGLALPANDPPAGLYAVLPPGRIIQVTGEEAHLDVLVKVLGDTPDRPVWVVVVEGEGKAGKPVAEVQIDGQVVGVLSTAVGNEILPLVRHLAAAGKAAVACGWVKGNALKADVTLRAAKASDVGAAWIKEHEAE